MLKPIFEKGSILKQTMLEALRDYPYTILELLYSGYGDGILSGFEVESIDDTKIVIGSGVLKQAEKIYFCDKKLTIDQKNENNYVYLETVSNPNCDGVEHSVVACQYSELQEEKIELFRYTKNAKLLLFQNFQELISLPINRINKIYSQYSIQGGTSLCPDYFKLYAYVVLSSNNAQAQDIAFAYQCLNGINDISLLYQYFNNNCSNTDIIEGMKHKISLLNKREETEKVESEQPPGPKKMIVS